MDPNTLKTILAQFGVSSINATLVSVVVSAVIAIASWLVQTQRIKDLERFKSELSTKEREVQAKLDAGVYVYQAQFDIEIDAYKKIWSRLVELRITSERLLSLFGKDPKEDPSEVAKRKTELLKEFNLAFNQFSTMTEEMKPFYAESVYALLNQIRDLADRAANDFEFLTEKSPGYSGKLRAHSEEIVKSIDQASDEIRARLAEVVPVRN